jgi:hypothetical protein
LFKIFSSVILFCTLLILSTSEATVDSWLDWEISRNDLSYNPSEFKALPQQQELRKYQTNEIYELKVSSEFIKSADPKPHLPEHKLMSFYIHPEALDLFSELIPKGQLTKIKVRPTSSPRSFYLGENQIVKLSLPQKINGAIRTIYPLQMSRALSVSEMLEAIPIQERRQAHFNFLPEVQAIYDGQPDSPFGFIIRQIPEEIISSQKTLVPLFAFLSQVNSQKDTRQKSLLEESALKLGTTPTHILKESVIPAILKSMSLAAEYGIVLEGHQQNLLLELDEENNFTGEIYYRDLDGARVDFARRKEKNISDQKYLNLQDAGWIFQFEQVTEINNSPLKNKLSRPKWWTPVMEFTLERYYIHSSFYLMKTYFQKEGVEFNVPKMIDDYFVEKSHQINHPICRKLF